jgi:hypothetical protein
MNVVKYINPKERESLGCEMRPPKFVSVVYFEGRLLMFEERGDVYEFNPRTNTYTVLSYAPWPENNPESEPWKKGKLEP